jgi:hemoglobin
VEENELYPLIGEDGFRRLVAAFYRQIPQDDILGPMYPREDFAGAEERLRNFLIYRFGGPPVYIEERGHPRLRMRHAPFPVSQSARDRWMQLMRNALAEVGLPADAERVLTAYFESTATFMLNRAEEQPDTNGK